MKLAAAITIAETLPDVTVGTKWDARTWMVGGRGFFWVRPLRKSDLAHYEATETVAPHGEIVAILVENLDAKDALLAMGLPGFFTIPHFNNYAALLVELRLARTAEVRAAIQEAHRVAVALGPPKTRKPKTRKPKTKPAAKRR